MKFHIYAFVIAILVSLAGSVQIFPLANPEQYVTQRPQQYRPSGVAVSDYKKYSGLTAGLWPGAIATEVPVVLSTIAASKDTSTAAGSVASAAPSVKAVESLARDLLPPKF